MKGLLFGPAGVPLACAGKGTPAGVRHVNKIGLGCMEMEFVHGVRMGPELAAQVKDAQKETGVVLTAHGPYYINLNSAETAKVDASIKRILDTARVANQCGGYSVTFHPAFYQGTPKEKVYETVKTHMKAIVRTLQDEGNKIWVRPETTGKATQFGDINELVKLSSELEQVMPCVDFSHLHARSGGKYNTTREFAMVLELIEKKLGKEALENMHIHLSGIAYSEKGERNHLLLDESDMNYKDLLKVLKEFKCGGVVVSESPNLEGDAMIMKREYERI